MLNSVGFYIIHLTNRYEKTISPLFGWHFVILPILLRLLNIAYFLLYVSVLNLLTLERFNFYSTYLNALTNSFLS